MAIPGYKGITLKGFAKDFYTRFLDSDLSGIAAELSYYFLFSIFPFLVFIVALAAYLPLQDTVQEWLGRMAQFMPKEAMGIIQDHLNGLFNNQRPRLLSVGVLVTIWSASRGVNAFITGLNIAYGVKDKRSWFKIQGIAIAMTLASLLLIFVALAVLVLGGKIGFFIADHLQLGKYYNILSSGLRWPLAALVIMTTVGVNFYILPDVKQSFKFIAPGSIIGTLLWLLVTWGFTVYAGHFGNYNATYGSIGGVIVLMTWLYLSALIFLIGGQINAILENASPDGKDRGERAPGAGAPPASEQPVDRASAVADTSQPDPSSAKKGNQASDLHRPEAAQKPLRIAQRKEVG